jgi:hypothetical protein
MAIRRKTAGQREASRSLSPRENSNAAAKLRPARAAQEGHDETHVDRGEPSGELRHQECNGPDEHPERTQSAPLELACGHPHEGAREDYPRLPEGVQGVVILERGDDRDDDAAGQNELRHTPPAGERAGPLPPPGENEHEPQDAAHRDGDGGDRGHVELHWRGLV